MAAALFVEMMIKDSFEGRSLGTIIDHIRAEATPLIDFRLSYFLQIGSWLRPFTE